MILLKRLAGVILTVLFCAAFSVEVILYTFRWSITGLPVPDEPKSVRLYQQSFNYLNIN